MPVPTLREPSKLPRPSTAYNNYIPKPSWNHPSKTYANKEELSKTRQNLRPRPSTALVSTGPKTCKTSLDLVPVRSRYCLTAEDTRKRAATKAPQKDERLRPQTRPAASPGQGCDITFLKKLLAMNKKQEIVINTKLVELMKEREPDLPRNDRANPSSAETRSGRGSERWQPTRQRERGLEYDLNGRRVYHFDEESDEGNAETWIANTTTVIETTSDCGDSAREVSSKRQSLTVIKQPVRSRRADQDEGRGREGEKLVVHCVEPDDDCKARAKKRLLKVWNYKSLLNSGKGGEGDGELKIALGDSLSNL